VWLIPIVAAVVGISLLINTLASRGPEISVTFRSADRLTPGKTAVRYKDVDIGLVKSVRLASDRSHVIASIELTKDAESFAVKDTRFWVVRPRFAISGVSGLETLLSAPTSAWMPASHGKARAASSVSKCHPWSPPTRPVASSCCAPRTWARSISARRSTIAACR
jgi:paraquat-inducible protein B